jgi:putative PIN family toxin of toxin-antitoxin system
MRAVLDSNVLARAVYSAGGPAEEVVRRLTAPPHVLILSEFLLQELRRVLRYPRLRRAHGLDDQEIERAVTVLESAAARVEMREEDVIRVVPHDPDDDRVVACAVAAGADVLCTRNRHLYHEAVVSRCRQDGIEVMDDVELLVRLRKMAGEAGLPRGDA